MTVETLVIVSNLRLDFDAQTESEAFNRSSNFYFDDEGEMAKPILDDALAALIEPFPHKPWRVGEPRCKALENCLTSVPYKSVTSGKASVDLSNRKQVSGGPDVSTHGVCAVAWLAGPDNGHHTQRQYSFTVR